MTTAVIVCPGRGTYNRSELGYLDRNFPDAALLDRFDALRREAGQDSLTALDGAAQFSASTHGRGDNASALIYAASYGDVLSIDRDRIEIVAVTGNSMGWYTALACGGALTADAGFRVSNTMGTLMQEARIGGQTVYPWMEDNWRPLPDRRAALLAQVAEIDRRADHVLRLSIDLGGMLILAGNAAGLNAFEAEIAPTQGRFPMRLANHAAFHSALQAPVAARGRAALPQSLFSQPDLPLIDGRGAIWWPGASDLTELWEYTFGQQVTETYDFTRAITVAAREFAPDIFIVPGPGTTLGGAVAQSLILANWRGLSDKASFRQQQANRPLLLSMGMADQRPLAV
ncbi:ACP S-malonyltransferase [Tropicimonas sp. IMCC6043]|uniref:ACP S-malonyltransferase n=1 Tax=Tropicimonas sp. IMCC6043 TaxID=2510645 RepID=UPI00101BAA52|nr:ACP S-malonyltransferase [Tropicimonas sp. IMCC6043]RYH09165.1 ACP S-malonyltransferase [Tropicimonas sp. IMCC6043]